MGTEGEEPGASQGDREPLAQGGEGDFLEQNGLNSPLCKTPAGVSGAARVNCSYSDFTAAPAPTGDYAFDVHIDTGLAHIGNTAVVVVEDILQWGWMILVALVRGLIVLIEWCYSLNLLSGATIGQVARALHAAEAALTLPALALALAVAATLFAYHGLVRRRVAQTLGEALVMVAMMVAGLWALVDPAGTVGVLGAWADRAGVATVGALADGTPERPQSTLAEDMRATFADVITGPWCYLEFGNVAWCRDPGRTDPRLRRAALRIAREAGSLAATRFTTGAAHRSLIASARLLEAARTNGALFLALPANGAARNSINDSGSLLSVLCGGSTEAVNCTGPTAGEAEFRTEHGAAARVIGLALVWLGALGMLGLFGWLALRLLGAAIVALLLLLAGPAVVLAPALGDGGRRLFRVWATRLLGALTAKLLYSVLLGVTLMMLNLLGAASALGWWMQWALISVMWWIAILRRHDLLGMMRVAETSPWTTAGPRGSATRHLATRTAARHAGRVAGRAMRGARSWTRQRLAPPPLGTRHQDQVGRDVWSPSQRRTREQVERTLRADLRRAQETLEQAPALEAELDARRVQLGRIEAAREDAELARSRRGEEGTRGGAEPAVRRALRLAARAERLERDIAERSTALSQTRAVVRDAQGAQGPAGRRAAFSVEQLRERGRFFDEQMALPDSRAVRRGGPRRDYRRLSSLAGVAEHDWENLVAEQKRAAILAIDRQLADRRALAGAARTPDERAPAFPAAGQRRPGAPSREAAAPAPPDRDRGTDSQKRSSTLAEWLEDERRRAAERATPETLAQRAARGRWDPADRDRQARRRRQLGRPRPHDE